MSNREHLYRGKRADNAIDKEDDGWVVGDLLHQVNGRMAIRVARRFGYIDYEVIPETVSEYIEKNDKNDKKIFNNDIVKTKYGRLCVVYRLLSPVYNAYDLRCIETATNISHQAPDEFDIWRSENLEVIGNVYDNPELLEV